jgi:hypothetical protein
VTREGGKLGRRSMQHNNQPNYMAAQEVEV